MIKNLGILEAMKVGPTIADDIKKASSMGNISDH